MDSGDQGENKSRINSSFKCASLKSLAWQHKILFMRKYKIKNID